MFATACDKLFTTNSHLLRLKKKYGGENWDDLIKMANNPKMKRSDAIFIKSMADIVQKCKEDPNYLDKQAERNKR